MDGSCQKTRLAPYFSHQVWVVFFLKIKAPKLTQVSLFRYWRKGLEILATIFTQLCFCCIARAFTIPPVGVDFRFRMNNR